MRSARDPPEQRPPRSRLLLPPPPPPPRHPRRPSSNWDAVADADAEAQLLHGLVTFRDRASRGQGKPPPPLNTPAGGTFNVEFARELQSLHLNLQAGASFGSVDGPSKSPPPPSAAVDSTTALDVNGDMLALAADVQLRQSLRWKKQQQSSAAATAAATNLSLFGGRLGGYFFLRAPQQPAYPFVTSTAQDGTDDSASSQSPGGGSRRLTYRKSRNGPRTQPDAAIELLLKSRTPTILGSGGGGWQPPPTVEPVTPPPAAPVLSVSIVSARSLRRGASAVTALPEVAPAPAAAPAALEPTRPAPLPAAAARVATAESAPRSRGREVSFEDTGDRSKLGKSGRKKRRKVTGLEMLDSMDSGPSRLAPPSPPPLLTGSVGDWTKTTMTTKTSASTATTKTRSTQPPAEDAAVVSTELGNSRGRSCLGQEEPEPQQQRAVSWRRHSLETGEAIKLPLAAAHLDGRISPQQRQQLPHLPRQATRSADFEPPDDRPLLLLPAPDQYRVAHEMARAANLNSQFEAWLRQGRDPDEFFSCRTTTGSYSYFPRLPRYDRGLDPFQAGAASATTAPQFNPAVRQQFYSRRKLTPAYLAYGGKNPDDYLPAAVRREARR